MLTKLMETLKLRLRECLNEKVPKSYLVVAVLLPFVLALCFDLVAGQNLPITMYTFQTSILMAMILR